jgi:hypothetical protein
MPQSIGYGRPSTINSVAGSDRLLGENRSPVCSENENLNALWGLRWTGVLREGILCRYSQRQKSRKRRKNIAQHNFSQQNARSHPRGVRRSMTIGITIDIRFGTNPSLEDPTAHGGTTPMERA